jgi:molybdopterin converting factor subunit 1
MTIVVLYFAALRELLGASEERLQLPDACRSVDDVARHLLALHPALGPHLSCVRFARNESFVGGSEPLADGDTLALIPPVSGG